MTKTAQDLPGDPSELHLEYSLRHRLREDPHDHTIERWTVTVRHGYEVHDDTRCPTLLGSDGEISCEDEAPGRDDTFCPAFEPDGVAMGRMVFFRVRMDRGMNAWWAMEEESADLHRIGCVLLDEESGDFGERAAEYLEYMGVDLLVMDRVVLDERWRGFGLGPILAAEAIERLSPGTRAVACMPGISDREPDRELGREEWDRVTARITAAWARVGFEAFADGVHLIDPATVVAEEALSVLREDFDDLCRNWSNPGSGGSAAGCLPRPGSGRDENVPPADASSSTPPATVTDLAARRRAVTSSPHSEL
ncbi:hypothetical protein OG948_59085 (plasmid) [Embleya sp. NBC_00888]|uniref:hypothetical protein n=1 Tax=Embleya sp. NBC_00888 TaxID=2975960 RepID=UPI002F919E31|nr:hypothetical protein OG948_59085 [Embleya sp. NBC_00888]